MLLFKHGYRVAKLAYKIGKGVGLTKDELEKLKTAALLHDIGKMRIDRHILAKSDKLTKIEFSEIKKHPIYSAEIVLELGYGSDIANIVLSHHERMDGQGYPRALKGNRIPFIARVISVCDAYDAMISHRSYSEPKSHENAVKELIRCSEGQFDSYVIDVFTKEVTAC